ncbi:hypothetical protein [Desulfobacter sp.]
MATDRKSVLNMEQDLKAVLTCAGFGNFTTQRLDTQFAYRVLLLSAVKI